MNEIEHLETKLNIKIRNHKLIQNAFVHRSFLNESEDFEDSNERLEYLGDAVIELATSIFLYKKYPKFQEGMLTSLRAALVKTTTLAKIAKELELDKHLKMSKGEKDTGGKMNQSILANTTEAFFGAIYLDQGMKVAESILEKFLFSKVDSILAKATYKDAKSMLQEMAQARFRKTPKYVLISEKGPSHSKEFSMQAQIGNKKYATGKGKSKQIAQEEAARLTLEMMSNT